MRTLIEAGNAGDTIDGSSGYRGRIAIAVVCAVAITALLLAGYAYLRKRHAQQTLTAQPPQVASTEPRGPAKVQIFVDDALMEGEQTIIGGTVKNISSEALTGLSVDLELKRRKDGAAQKTSAQVLPAHLAPQEEGHYSLRIRSADYSAVKLVALKGGADSALLAFATSPGKKRLPEKLEGKTIIVNRPPPKDGFLNTPDTPGRVP